MVDHRNTEISVFLCFSTSGWYKNDTTNQLIVRLGSLCITKKTKESGTIPQVPFRTVDRGKANFQDGAPSSENDVSAHAERRSKGMFRRAVHTSKLLCPYSSHVQKFIAEGGICGGF